MPEQTARDVALCVLTDYEHTDSFLSTLLSVRLQRSGLDRRDRAFTTELVQGTVRMKLTLDWCLKDFSDRPLAGLDAPVAWALRLGAYQVLFTSVPDYAAVAGTVDSAMTAAGRGAGGYVNAVMRAFSAGQADVLFPDRLTDPAGWLEVRYSHPRWVAEMWIEELGLEKAEELCSADNSQPSLSLRTNLTRVTRQDLSARLQEKGVEVSAGTMTPECLLAKGTGPPGDLQEFEQGLFGVQDQAAQLVGRLVDPRRGMRVIDMCAAPGGKANHAAEMMRNEGEVLALDVNGMRLAMVGEGAARLGNTCITMREMDATRVNRDEQGVFDRVLLDAPCTGLGTLSRRPDVRWRRKREDIERLSVLQGQLLEAAAGVCAPGGRLVYSTCTVSRRENQDVVESFLQRACDFVLMPVEIEGEEHASYAQIFPEAGKCDGMFLAVLVRKA